MAIRGLYVRHPRAIRGLSCPNGGERIRTSDLRVMSPTSYQLLYPAII